MNKHAGLLEAEFGPVLKIPVCQYRVCNMLIGGVYSSLPDGYISLIALKQTTDIKHVLADQCIWGKLWK